MRIPAVLLALGIDLFLGELPNRFHPVVLMGGYIRAFAARGPEGNFPRFLHGALLVVSGLILFGGTAAAAAYLLAGLPAFITVVAGAFLLKQTLSVRSLLAAGRSVEDALYRGDLSGARGLLSFHLVSRDTSGLSREEVAGAAIESLAENITDGIASPLFYFALFGLPGAWGFRFVNTSDSMIAYRDPEREYLGKFTAWVDTALNFIPARLCAFAVAAGAAVRGADGSNALRIMFSQHGRTPSRNAGWTMAAMAGALRVTLEKRGVYRLEGGGVTASAETLAAARRIVAAAAAILTAVLILVSGGAYVLFA